MDETYIHGCFSHIGETTWMISFWLKAVLKLASM
ncbi:hypothetical protein V6Z12_D10G163900 [Gossypium hirsutum]